VDSHSIRKQGKDKNKWEKFSLDCDLNDFSRYGVGLTLYLNFLKKMAILFSLMALISIPALVSNIIGDGVINNKIKLKRCVLA
jgi:hypothetical protein